MQLFGHKLSWTAAFGLFVIAINLCLMLFAPWIAPHHQNQIVADAWLTPNSHQWLGTDDLGRDLLTRLIYGARTSIGLALSATLLCFTLGVSTGFAAAIAGGWVDTLLSRLVDLLLSMPLLIFAFMILSVMGTATPVLILTVGILNSAIVYRLARSVAMGIVVQDYVEAARLRGEGLGWIMLREILPNAAPPLLAEFGLRFCFTFLLIAALSFLGLGVQAPNADWGSMVKDLSGMISLGSAAPFYPAGAIALLTIGVNFIVDWLLSIQSRGHGVGA